VVTVEAEGADASVVAHTSALKIDKEKTQLIFCFNIFSCLKNDKMKPC
jgi:hypothetical protein